MSVPVPPGAVVDDPKKPWKALVPIVLGVLYAVIEVVQIQLGDGSAWDNDDWTAVALAVVTAIGVYLTRNPKTSADGR